MGQLRPPPLSADAPPPRGNDIADVCVLVVEWQRRRRPAERAEDAGPQVGHGAGAGGGGGEGDGREKNGKPERSHSFLGQPMDQRNGNASGSS